MALNVGTRVGPYEIVATLGVGGMGEVYRARDTTLQRDVAIKVIPAAMAGDARRLARFEREARALAALNHPNIASVYGIVENQPVHPAEPAPHGGSDRAETAAGAGSSRPPYALVMELVEGQDLSWRLRAGPLALAEALPIARQVAEALAAAHEAGIVHRDLKPANIKVREDGTVKVLDFGLAKGTSPDFDAGGEALSGSGSESGIQSDGLAQTVTLHGGMTEDGDVVGTIAYMAPEQASGKAVDKRADIWSFGVVLFEMLAGRRPFAGVDSNDTAARVMATEPDWGALPAEASPSIRRLLVRCLTKDRKHRLHDIADARLEIDEAIASPTAEAQGHADYGAASSGRIFGRRSLALGVAGVSVGLALGAGVWRTPAVAGPVTYARLGVEPAAELHAGGVHPSVVLTAGGARTALAWLPDGRTLVFLGVRDGVRQVFLRDLASDAARPLAGTEGARAFGLSPDGRELAFWTDGAISKITIAGGPVARLCDTGVVHGLAWGPTRIVFAGAPFLMEVSPAGGQPRRITDPPELVRHATPFLLPGDAALLYTEYEKQWVSGDERVMLLPMAPGGNPRVLLRNAADARYLATGHLAFLRQGTLFIVPFDAGTLELRGNPVAMVKDVAQSVVAWDSDDLTLAGQFAVSPQGTLAYVASQGAGYPDRELVAVDRQGRVTSVGAPARGYRNHVEVSPDGTRLAVSVQTATDVRLFAYDLRRGSLSRIAESIKGEAIVAAWSRDDRIAVHLVEGGKVTAAIVRPEAGSPAVPVAHSNGFWASSWSPDGHLVGMKGGHLWMYAPDAPETRPSEIVSTNATEMQPMWSPDGRWLTYTSTSTGRQEIHLRPFPGPGEPITVSTNGGTNPAWNPNGRELFYIEPGSGRDRMMAVRLGPSGQPGRPAALFAFPHDGLFLGTAVLTPYAVSPDGQRFYAVKPLPRVSTPVTGINVVFNWFEELKAKAGFQENR